LQPARNLDRYVGQRGRFQILKFNRARGNVVVSRRSVIERERTSLKEETLKVLEEGVILEGTVKNITDYGAFVDLGGIDGLLHITDMAWGRLQHPSEVLKVGEKVKVVVLKYDQGRERVSLGMKQIMPDPWTKATESYRPIISRLAEGIQEGDGGKHLISIHPDPSPATSSFMHAEPWLSFNSIQVWNQLRSVYPMTLADYHASRWVVEPFHLYDCCLVSNGGLAVIVTSAERAKNLKRPPVYILGMAQGHPGGDPMETLVSGAPIAKTTAFKMADIKLNDVDFCEIYDCYTFTVLVTLEDYGFCEKGEGGPFVATGAIGPGGSIPVNTGGGQLSSFYMWGMTPVSEAIVQIRGEGGRRQVPKHEVGLVSGNGGILATHSTLVLGSHP